MKLCFTLSMPGCGSWNGRWSGEDRFYAIVESFSTIKRKVAAVSVLANGPYHYRWPDGWIARVDVREVDNGEARKIKRQSQGFCGYDWMVASIISHGKILADHEKPTAQTVC